MTHEPTTGNTAASDALLPCPWCGETMTGTPTVIEGSTFRWRRVQGCCADGPEVRVDTMANDRAIATADADRAAIDAWNTRPAAGVPELVAELNVQRGQNRLGGARELALKDQVDELVAERDRLAGEVAEHRRCIDCSEPTGRVAVCQTCSGLRCESVSETALARSTAAEARVAELEADNFRLRDACTLAAIAIDEKQSALTAAESKLAECERDAARFHEYLMGRCTSEETHRNAILQCELRCLSDKPPTLDDWRAAIDAAIAARGEST